MKDFKLNSLPKLELKLPNAPNKKSLKILDKDTDLLNYQLRLKMKRISENTAQRIVWLSVLVFNSK